MHNCLLFQSIKVLRYMTFFSTVFRLLDTINYCVLLKLTYFCVKKITCVAPKIFKIRYILIRKLDFIRINKSYKYYNTVILITFKASLLAKYRVPAQVIFLPQKYVSFNQIK